MQLGGLLTFVALVVVGLAGLSHGGGGNTPPVSDSSSSPTWPIEHVVVLMLENRAFDHMLGFLEAKNPLIDGINDNTRCPLNASNPEDGYMNATSDAVYVSWGPAHSIQDTTFQIFGTMNEPAVLPDVAPMSGFVEDACYEGDPAQGRSVMAMFNETMVPVISELAAQYGVFNRWFSSVPGPTEINRMYVGSATSDGAGYNDRIKLAEGYPQTTIFDHLDEAGVSWASFYSDFPSTLFFRNMREPHNLKNVHTLFDFEDMAKKGELPAYSFIEPRYLQLEIIPATDQHPSHSVAEGELFIKQVYEALRAAPTWNTTLFLLTYDEHGGFYDHVPTPLEVPNPDGKDCDDPPFNFTRLGVRVPALAISPWVNAGTVFGAPTGPFPTSEFEHSSVAATLKKMFGLPDFLTKRDEWAGTFEEIVMGRSEPRTDCPMTLPDPPRALLAKPVAHTNKVDDFHEIVVRTAAALAGVSLDESVLESEDRAGKFVMDIAYEYIEKAHHA